MGDGWLFVGFVDAIRGVGAATTLFQTTIRRPEIRVHPHKLNPMKKAGSRS